MDPYRDELCDRLAILLLANEYAELDHTGARSAIYLGVWEWLESSDYANEELETLTLGELTAAWQARETP